MFRPCAWDAGDLFSNLNMDNAVVIFVIGIILAMFAAFNFVGYKKDIRDREAGWLTIVAVVPPFSPAQLCVERNRTSKGHNLVVTVVTSVTVVTLNGSWS